MNQEEEKQIVFVIGQFDKQRSYIPFLHNLDKHPMYGSFFMELDGQGREKVQDIIDAYIVSEIQALSTKWWEMFRRFYGMNKELFWKFRQLNADEANIETDAFHEVGKQVEEQLYKFEQILTKNMMKKPMWLAKVTDAYYDIACRFFPHYFKIR